jgi:MATE family multidrug resistance protein
MANERTPLLEQNGSSDITTLKHEVKTIFLFTIPILGAQLLEYSLQIASIISIGHISTISLAAATLGTMTANVTAFSIIQGCCSALDTLLPSAWTSSHPNLVGLWSQRMGVIMALLILVSIFFGCLFCNIDNFNLQPILVIWFSSEAILLALKQEPEIAHLAALFLKYMAIGLPGYAFNNVSRRYFQAQGRFSIPATILIIVAPINILLNYLLGKLHPRLPLSFPPGLPLPYSLGA